MSSEAQSNLKAVSDFSLDESKLPASSNNKKRVGLASKNFVCSSIVYLNSCIFALDKGNENMVRIRMDNYRPTRPSSLSFNRWRLESSFAELSKILKKRLEEK